jgi:hypothetical protein
MTGEKGGDAKGRGRGLTKINSYIKPKRCTNFSNLFVDQDSDSASKQSA